MTDFLYALRVYGFLILGVILCSAFVLLLVVLYLTGGPLAAFSGLGLVILFSMGKP